MKTLLKPHFILYSSIVICTFIFCSCVKDPKPTPIIIDGHKGVLICNEGNFMYGNASLSFYDSEKDSVFNQIFFNTNNFPLGDVAFSINTHNNKVYVVVNNSGKIMVIDINNFKHISTISELISPRYINIINDNKAYISNLYSPYIDILNPATHTITSNIFIGNGTEQMCLVDEHIYATSWSYNDKVYKINTKTDQVMDSLAIAKQPNGIVCDINNNLWILSDGGYTGSPFGQDTAALTCISTETFTIIKEFKFHDISNSPNNLCISQSGETLYFINNNSTTHSGVFKININDVFLPEKPIIKEESRLLYGLGIDPNNSDIYISDAIDYTQNGNIYRYDKNGTLITNFSAGITPRSFCFINED